MRRKNDFYPTPEGAARALRNRMRFGVHQPLEYAEPCVGDGALVRGLGIEPRWTNDIDPQMRATYHFDASKLWPVNGVPWVITNPPFSLAAEILVHSLARATEGVAMLLRLSFLEPTRKRAEQLVYDPPTHMLVLPRLSFTGDGKADSVTCAWMVWDRRCEDNSHIQAATREEVL